MKQKKTGSKGFNPWNIELCRGVDKGCVNALPMDAGLLQALERVLEQSGWAERLAETLGDGGRPHHSLRVHVSACPNGCSRPPVADLGLLAAQPPVVAPGVSCTGCGECERSCPDEAVRVVCSEDGFLPEINPDRCLECGLCVRACEFGVLQPGVHSLRVQVGGKLGRRPLLAAELQGRYDAEGTAAVLEAALQVLLQDYRPGMRLADLRRAKGDAWLEDLS